MSVSVALPIVGTVKIPATTTLPFSKKVDPVPGLNSSLVQVTIPEDAIFLIRFPSES